MCDAIHNTNTREQKRKRKTDSGKGVRYCTEAEKVIGLGEANKVKRGEK